MKRAMIGIPLAGVVASLLLLAASCGGTTEPAFGPPAPPPSSPTPPATAAATATPSGEPAADMNNPAEVTLSAWTDDDAVRALAADCKWDPGGCIQAIEVAALRSMDGINFAPDPDPAADSPPDSEPDPLTPRGVCRALTPLACAHVPGQSCAPDECSQSDYECVPACDRTCSGCTTTCVTACESCKSTCKDEACRLTCAKSCGECRQSCLQALDRCSTAHCSEEGDRCYRERDDEWQKSACPKVCPKVQTCVEKCPEVENDYTGSALYFSDCAKKCLTTLGKGCPARFDRICAGDPNASVNFNVYRESRAAGNTP